MVLLSHFNHCLAHYYLCLCLKGELKYKNEHAFIKMVNIKTRFEFDFNLFLTEAIKYNQIYENFISEQSIKAKQRFSNGGTNKGKHYFTDGNVVICRDICPEGFVPYSRNKGVKFSSDTKAKMSEAGKKRWEEEECKNKLKAYLKVYYSSHSGVTTNRKWITNGTEEKLVDLENYVLEGEWRLGRSDRSKMNNKKNWEKGRRIQNENKKAK